MKKMKRLIFLIPCLIFTAIFAQAQISQTIRSGFTVERELGETEKHIYEVNLAKGQMLNFVVEQRGIDVLLRVLTADGKFIDRVDSPNGREGEEPFKMVSLEGGRCRIEVSRLWTDVMLTTGKYLVKPIEIRPATNHEIKTMRLKEELLKIVAEDNRSGSYPDALRRYYLDKGLQTNGAGSVASAAEMIEITTKNPFKPPAGFSSEAEYSAVRLEDFGDVLVMSVRRDLHVKNPQADENYKTAQQISYVFKRTDGAWRVINVQKTFTDLDRKIVKLDTGQLDALVGIYAGGKASDVLTITREGNTLFGKLGTAGEKFEMFAESENTFYVGFISIGFVRDANGAVTQSVIYWLSQAQMTIQPKIK